VPALVITVAVLAGNGLMYHDTSLAPYARLHDLEHIGKRFAGQGPTLTPDFEEYAEYYLRDDDQDSMVNGPRLELAPGVNRAAEPGGIYVYDLDEYPLKFVESFRTIVMRRSPTASRPPSNYRLVYLSTYYEVWQREQPATTVYAHVSLRGTADEDHHAAVCASVVATARRAGPAAQIAYMPTPSYVQLGVASMALSRAFQASGGAIIARGPGRARERLTLPGGRYDFYLSGSFGRPVDVSVDGRHVGTAAYQESYPGEWLLIGVRRLSGGSHRVEITRGGVSLHPGNGNALDLLNRTIGPLVIIPARPAVPPVRYSSVRDFNQLCHSPVPLRWVEVVRPA
jgi:hypothetical protein